MIVYKITHKDSGKAYVGQTKYSLAHRWHQHTRGTSHCIILAAALKKYGKQAFTKEILYTYTNKTDLIEAEQYLIAYHNTVAPCGYNATTGGEAPEHTAEAKLKLSLSKLGAKNPMFGKTPSEEHRRKISAALMGKKRPPEVKDKIRASHNPISDKNLTYRRKG